VRFHRGVRLPRHSGPSFRPKKKKKKKKKTPKKGKGPGKKFRPYKGNINDLQGNKKKAEKSAPQKLGHYTEKLAGKKGKR